MAWYAVSQAKWTTTKSSPAHAIPAFPRNCLHLHLQLAPQLYLGPRLRSKVANSQVGGTDLDSLVC